jgi:hypothetical protein
MNSVALALALTPHGGKLLGPARPNINAVEGAAKRAFARYPIYLGP